MNKLYQPEMVVSSFNSAGGSSFLLWKMFTPSCISNHWNHKPIVDLVAKCCIFSSDHSLELSAHHSFECFVLGLTMGKASKKSSTLSKMILSKWHLMAIYESTLLYTEVQTTKLTLVVLAEVKSKTVQVKSRESTRISKWKLFSSWNGRVGSAYDVLIRKQMAKIPREDEFCLFHWSPITQWNLQRVTWSCYILS